MCKKGHPVFTNDPSLIIHHALPLNPLNPQGCNERISQWPMYEVSISLQDSQIKLKQHWTGIMFIYLQKMVRARAGGDPQYTNSFNFVADASASTGSCGAIVGTSSAHLKKRELCRRNVALTTLPRKWYCASYRTDWADRVVGLNVRQCLYRSINYRNMSTSVAGVMIIPAWPGCRKFLMI